MIINAKIFRGALNNFVLAIGFLMNDTQQGLSNSGIAIGKDLSWPEKKN